MRLIVSGAYVNFETMNRRITISSKEAVLLLLIVGAFVVHSLLLDFTQDDAYISYRYVENFTEGHGLVFNYGERVEGYTNFLWIMILSLTTLLGLPIIAVSKILGVAFGAGTLIVTYFLFRHCFPRSKILIRLIPVSFLAANGALAYWVIGGLETGMFVFLATLAIFTELRQPRLTPLILILATLTRPEGGLLFGIILLYRLLITKQNARALVTYAVAYILPLIPYGIFKVVYFGDLLPNPFYAKTGASLEYFRSGIEYFVDFAYHYGAFGLLFVLPLLFIRKLPDEMKLLWMTSLIYTVYIVLVGGDVLKVHRFFLPILPVLFVLAAFALFRLMRHSDRHRWITLLVPLLAVAFIVWSVLIPRDYIRRTRHLERNFIDKMTLVTDKILEVDRSNFSIATTTIGKVSYNLKGHSVIDMLGLTDRHIAKNPESIEGMKTTWKERNFNTEYLLSLKPDYILFSTGHKASAPAERALLLNSQFRRNYSTIGFLAGGRMKVVWKRYGDFSDPNVKLKSTEFADLMYDALNAMSASRFREAEPPLLKAVEICDHDFALAEFLLGQCYAQTGRIDEMISQYEKAIEIDPNHIESRVDLLSFYSTKGDQLKAAEVSKDLNRIAPWLLR